MDHDLRTAAVADPEDDPFPPTEDPAATEGVTVVLSWVPGQSDLVSIVDDHLAALDRAAERHRVVLVVDGDSEAGAGALVDLYPDRLEVVRREECQGGAPVHTGLRAAAAHPDHRRVFLTDGRFAAAQLPDLLAVARRERADVVVGYRRDRVGSVAGGVRDWLRTAVCLLLLGTGRRCLDSAHLLVDRRALVAVELTGPPAAAPAELIAKLRTQGARILHRPVHHMPGRDHKPTGSTATVTSLLGVWADLLRAGPVGRAARRLLPPRDPVLGVVLLVAAVLSIGACVVVAAHQTTLAYPDAVSHLMISRRVLDASTRGAAQFGGVWLPLPHGLNLPLVARESWYHSGVAACVVSMCAYVATAGWLYRIGVDLTGRRVGGVTAALVFCANPNVLYLQSTPMTEALLFACLAATTWHLLRWCRHGDYRHLAATAVAVLAATLVRYEGWVFLVAVAAVVGLHSWRRARPKPWVRVRAELVFFGCLAVSGVVGWAVWNAAIFGDPLNFLRGEFAKPALWVSAGERAVGDWGVSSRTYLYAMNHDLGPLILLLATAGLVCYVWRTRLRAEAPAPLPLLVFLPFFVCALHSGQRPLHVPEIGGDLYNVRFALVMVLPAAVFTAYLVVLIRWAWVRLLPAFLVLSACGLLSLSGTATLEEARAFRTKPAERANAVAAAWLREHYDHGRVLMQSWSNETVGFDSRVPTDQVVDEGSFRQWEPALADPAGHGIRWIHLRRTPGAEDRVWRSLHDNPLMHRDYRSIYADDHHVFYRRVEQPPCGDGPAGCRARQPQPDASDGIR
ncbi:glycosyltransferase family 39 protein [Actinosynnema sp. CS-041913]|uniref:glycosyltransferase family 39 protein n=1 Tax=Actinosynnema sp. CS-041913 TaxID=3239917 RepID=UPI003D8E1403